MKRKKTAYESREWKASGGAYGKADSVSPFACFEHRPRCRNSGLRGGQGRSKDHGDGGGGGCDYHGNHYYYYYYDFTSQYDQAVRIDKADICFVGDSLTQLGLWSEFFPGRTVINRGIGSDVSEGVLNRLDSVVDHRPDIVFLMIGVNDLGKGIPEAETVGNVRKIVSSLSASLSDATMVIQSVLPAKGIAEDAILRFNEDYKQIASELRPRRISGSPSPLSCRRGAQRLPLFGRRSSPR